MLTVLLWGVVSAITLLSFLIPSPVLQSVFALFAAGAVLYVDVWLCSASRFAIALAMVGVLFLGMFAPMYALDTALAVEGVRTMATVSEVDLAVSPKGTRTYTVWLTDAYGKPIDRPLADAGPWREGDEFVVVFDPHGLVPTERPMTITRSWPLPATLVSALVAIGGLALMARRREV